MANQDPDRITIIAPSFSAAAIEFHRSRMSERGYQMDGPIVERHFLATEGVEPPKDLFDGAPMFAVNFVKVGVDK